MPACCWTSTRGDSALIRALGARAVGDVDEVDAVDAQLPRLLDERVGVEGRAAAAARR